MRSGHTPILLQYMIIIIYTNVCRREVYKNYYTKIKRMSQSETQAWGIERVPLTLKKKTKTNANHRDDPHPTTGGGVALLPGRKP